MYVVFGPEMFSGVLRHAHLNNKILLTHAILEVFLKSFGEMK